MEACSRAGARQQLPCFVAASSSSVLPLLLLAMGAVVTFGLLLL